MGTYTVRGRGGVSSTGLGGALNRRRPIKLDLFFNTCGLGTPVRGCDMATVASVETAAGGTAVARPDGAVFGRRSLCGSSRLGSPRASSESLFSGHEAVIGRPAAEDAQRREDRPDVTSFPCRRRRRKRPKLGTEVWPLMTVPSCFTVPAEVFLLPPHLLSCWTFCGTGPVDREPPHELSGWGSGSVKDVEDCMDGLLDGLSQPQCVVVRSNCFH